jgi:hypothetical protein
MIVAGVSDAVYGFSTPSLTPVIGGATCSAAWRSENSTILSSVFASGSANSTRPRPYVSPATFVARATIVGDGPKS